MTDYGFFKEIGFEGNLSIEDYKNNKLIIDKSVLIDFLEHNGKIWGALKVEKDPFTHENFIPYIRQAGKIRWSEFLVKLININIFPPEEFQLYIETKCKTDAR